MFAKRTLIIGTVLLLSSQGSLAKELETNLQPIIDINTTSYNDSSDQQQERELSDPRIIGGTTVLPNTYPWFARATTDSHARWGGCGGVLVTPEYVLTAAHCIEGDIASFVKNKAGFEIGALCAPFLNGDNCGQKIEKFLVTEVFIHPKFEKSGYLNDFALLRLDGLSTITPVPMDLAPKLSNTYASGKSGLWVIGEFASCVFKCRILFCHFLLTVFFLRFHHLDSLQAWEIQDPMVAFLFRMNSSMWKYHTSQIQIAKLHMVHLASTIKCCVL